MKNVVCRLLLLLIWLPLDMYAIGGAALETPRGSIRINVVDPSGAVVPGATVSCESAKTGAVKTCTTNDDGFCFLGGLEVGSYELTVEARGFKNSVHSPVAVNAAKSTVLESQLEVGSATETVSITSEAPQTETESTQRGVTLSSKEILSLPVSRNFSDLVLLTPGVTADSVSRTSNGAVSFSANGGRTRSNNFLLDGTEVTDSYKNTIEASVPDESQGHAPILPAEALAEFRVLTSFDARDGRNSGALVDLTIKNGTNEIHGSAFQFIRNDVLNARDFFNSIGAKNKLRYNNFGFSVGGPFKKDQAFWFGAYEGRRENKENTTLLAVPSNSDFTQAILVLGGDPGIPLALNPVVNPVIRNLFALCRSSAQCPGGEDLWPQPTPTRESQVLNSLATTQGRVRSDNVIVKTQFTLNEQNGLSAYYSRSDAKQRFPLALAGGDALPNTNTLNESGGHTVSISHSLTVDPYRLNELRIGWNRYRKNFLDEDRIGIGNPAESIGLDTGVTSSRDFGLPHLVVGDFSFLGASPFSNSRGWDGANWHLAERLDWVSANHSWNFGYEFKRATVDSFNDVNFRGKLEFDSLRDFLAGEIARGAISKGNSDRTTAQNSHAAYIHDLFRWSSRLSLDFGIRWEYFAPLQENLMLFSAYDPARGLTTIKKLYKGDFNNFSPRVGFVWDLTGKGETVLRASGGVNFDAFPQDFFIGQIKFNTFNAGVAYNAISERPILTSRSPTATILQGQPVFPASTLSSDTRDVSTVATIDTPYVLSYNLNLQHQLFRNTVLEIAYVGSNGRKLFRTRDINAPTVPGGPRPFDKAAILSSVAPNHPFVVNQIETSATSNYNSLQTSVRQRSWYGLTNIFHWTWSHSIDDASDGIDSVPNLASPDNHHAPFRERASSRFDTRHRVVWGFIYDLPESIGDLQLGEGWQISGILTFSSGQPYHVNFGDEFDSIGSNDFILRPDVVGDPLFGTASPDRLLNLAAFQVPCTLDGSGTDVSNCIADTLHFGNLPRNAFIGPNFRNLDFSVSKTTNLTETIKVQFKSEFFNLTNHPNFSSPLFPQFIARASQKGIDTNGRGGAKGTGCNTASSSNDCYLSATRTSNGPRFIKISIKLIF